MAGKGVRDPEKWVLDELGGHGVAVMFEPHAHRGGPY